MIKSHYTIEVMGVRAEPPKPFIFSPDFTSSVLYYDKAGKPKKYAPSKRLSNGEYAYCLSPFRDNPPLKGEALINHINEIEAFKKGM
jgi:hypothetical protein